MAEKGVLFGETAAKQIVKTVREVSRRTVNESPHRGRWQQRQGGGGGLDIEFTVISMDCYSTPWILTVEVTWFSGGCTASIPGADTYTGYVEVENRCNIANHFTAENIVGLTGTATYRYPRTGTCTPTWRLDDICSANQCP